MAFSYSTDAGTIIIPSAVVNYKVQPANSGLATNGVLMLVGEADAGPRFSLESALQDNAFGPDQLGAVIAKYRSGPLVDAFAHACSPANDPNIVGAFNRVIIVKTNDSAKAKSALTVHGGGAYNGVGPSQMSLADKSYGKLGNLIYYTIDTKTAEVVPTTSAFTLLLPIASTNLSVRANGGASQAVTFAALSTPATNVGLLNALSGVTATGGTDRGIIGNISGNLSLTVLSGNNVQIDYDENWDGTIPSAGDTLYIPATSPLSPGLDANAGSYVVTAATANQILATKLMDAAGAPGTLTAPANVGLTAVINTTDLQAFAPVVISIDAGNPVAGQGKVLEIAELTTATDRLSNLCYTLNTTKVSWVSKSGAPKLIVSGAEYAATLNVNRQKDNVQESLSAGGEIALKVGYTGTTASLTIDDDTLAITRAGGSGGDISIDLKDFPTIQDVATYINSQTGYTAAVGTGILGQLPSTALDNVTGVEICTTFGEQPGRVKIDAYRFANKVNGDSVLVQLQNASSVVGQAAAGLPQPVTAVTYLSGGTKGTTTDADVTAALSALEKVRGNFLVPLFSRDASADVADKLTEVGSDYLIANVQSGVRAHVLKMSSLKAGKNRQGFLSGRDTFSNVKNTASNIASYRCAFPFQDVRVPNAEGISKQAQPWMAAVNAAAMQAAAFYKAIVGKFAAIQGAVQAAGDFDDGDDSQVEEALLAGLLPLRRAESGGWKWVSDQTTYGADNNFVFNSIQATYAADIIALTTKQRMEQAFVGQSTADVNANLAVAFVESILTDFRRLKLITASDDAPRGFKNIKVKITGTTMAVSFEVKLAGAIYFVPIFFLVSQVEQSA